MPLAEPPELNAVTVTRNVLPTSVELKQIRLPRRTGRTVSTARVAADTTGSVQVIGCVPFHVPVLELNVCPSCAVPEITGGDTSDGATADGAADTRQRSARTIAVAEPFLFDAVTADPQRRPHIRRDDAVRL